MATSFERAFAIVVGLEGGYVNSPNDPGGETKYGISRRQYPLLDIKNLTLEAAQAIYLRDYWTPHNLDALEWGKALCVFDVVVNGGPHRDWWQQFGLLPLAQFVESFNAERLLYMQALPDYPPNRRGWCRRVIRISTAATS